MRSEKGRIQDVVGLWWETKTVTCTIWFLDEGYDVNHENIGSAVP